MAAKPHNAIPQAAHPILAAFLVSLGRSCADTAEPLWLSLLDSAFWTCVFAMLGVASAALLWARWEGLLS
jgi:hypothetical protein